MIICVVLFGIALLVFGYLILKSNNQSIELFARLINVIEKKEFYVITLEDEEDIEDEDEDIYCQKCNSVELLIRPGRLTCGCQVEFDSDKKMWCNL